MTDADPPTIAQIAARLEKNEARLAEFMAIIEDLSRGSTHELVRYWLNKTVALEAELAELKERRPGQLLAVVREGGGLIADEVPWLVKDFGALYTAAEGALAQATMDGYSTAHTRDLSAQLARLKPAKTECDAVRQACLVETSHG